VWLGLTAAYFSVYPVGFYITSFGFGLYVLAAAWKATTARISRSAQRQALAL
jgi:zinc/manganese transport system permease protein